jgi:hypothetical protein
LSVRDSADENNVRWLKTLTLARRSGGTGAGFRQRRECRDQKNDEWKSPKLHSNILQSFAGQAKRDHEVFTNLISPFSIPRTFVTLEILSDAPAWQS